MSETRSDIPQCEFSLCIARAYEHMYSDTQNITIEPGSLTTCADRQTSTAPDASLQQQVYVA